MDLYALIGQCRVSSFFNLQAMRAKLMSTLVILVVLATVHGAKVCTRTFKNREHLHPSVYNLPPPTDAEILEMSALPPTFDWCDQGYCTSSWNQHIPQYCGSCFAHGSLSAAQDRIKIQNIKNGYKGPDVMLGRQTFLNCAPSHGLSNGCNGGEPADVFEFMHHYGLPDETCLHYNATDNTKYTSTNFTCPPEGYCINCMTLPGDAKPSCFPVKKMIRYRAKEYGRLSGEHAIMKEILNGPVTCGLACNDDFTFNYSAGIYEDKTGFMAIDHDVEVVGWGEEDGVKYWHVRNSWGTYWGMNGFFKIVRGKNNLAIESDCHYMIPDISDEELVFTETPIFGGSHFGIVPFSKDRAAFHPIASTEDVTLNNKQVVPNELPEIKDLAVEIKASGVNALSSNHHMALMLIMCTVFGAVVGGAVSRWSYRSRYATIN